VSLVRFQQAPLTKSPASCGTFWFNKVSKKTSLRFCNFVNRKNNSLKLITARTFVNPMDAHLLKSRLESEGISCYLKDEHSISIDPLHSNALGGVKLQIHENDIEKVMVIFKEIDNTPYKDEENNITKCPNCESSELIAGYISIKSIAGVLSAILSILFMVFPFHVNTLFKCKKCGTEFKLK